MRILYGVVGEGMGHAMRSRVILDELVKDHTVQVVVSGRAYDYLQKRASEHLRVKKIWGYTLVYEDNEVQNWKTVTANLKGAMSGWPQNVRAYYDIVNKFEPDVVISDFETWSYLFAQRHNLPVISVDNMQIINRCTHDEQILQGVKNDFELTRAIVKAKVPGSLHYHITTFFYPPVRKERTTLHPPILRPEILAATPGEGDHLLVYQTSTSNTGLLDALKACGKECRIYGMRRDLQEEVREGNLRFKPFSEAGFIEDLRTAAGVVASAGFTLMGEAVYLRRPMLAVPLQGQFEQVLNARYLEREGYGQESGLVDGAALARFIERLPDFRKRLGGYQQDGNRDLLDGLKRSLVDATKPRLG
ncbi:MAG: glycosyltransferase family protein [Deltaproteobacteria bacterium]|nr:glycosyltransferase family protein [Deltaproteobacteria bacterium]